MSELRGNEWRFIDEVVMTMTKFKRTDCPMALLCSLTVRRGSQRDVDDERRILHEQNNRQQDHILCDLRPDTIIIGSLLKGLICWPSIRNCSWSLFFRLKRNMRGALSRKDSTKGRTNLVSKVAQSKLPHLTINSLILLGFNSDEYIQIYSGIAFDLVPLESTSFDRTNERMLMVILHYLLLILDEDEFATSIQPYWPCLDNNEKRRYQRAIMDSLARLVAREELPGDVLQPALLTQAQGTKVWEMLKTISDRCLEVMIGRFEQVEQPPADVLAGVEAEPENQPQYASNKDWTVDQLLTEITLEFQQLKRMVLDMELENRERADYLHELDTRLRDSEKTMKKLEHELRQQHLNDEHRIMSEQAKHKREKIAEKLESQMSLLQAFLDTQLMNKVVEHLEDLSDDDKSVGSVNSSPTKSPQRNLSRLQSIKKLQSASGPVVLEDLEKQQTNLRSVIDNLVQKIDEVAVYF